MKVRHILSENVPPCILFLFRVDENALFSPRFITGYAILLSLEYFTGLTTTDQLIQLGPTKLNLSTRKLFR